MSCAPFSDWAQSWRCLLVSVLLGSLALPACSTPTLVQVARRRQAGVNGDHYKDDVRVGYHLTDLDVLNFSDEVKKKLAHRSSFHMGVRYGSAGTQATLGPLPARPKSSVGASALPAGSVLVPPTSSVSARSSTPRDMPRPTSKLSPLSRVRKPPSTFTSSG